MRKSLALAALLLPLGGCVVPPQPIGYGYGGYPQPGYPPAGYPGPVDYSYPGYAYNDGSPTLFAEGVTWPLVFAGGGWGYWDGFHRWHRAPAGIERNLQLRHPNGVGFRPFGGGQFGRPEGPRFGPMGGGRPPGIAAGGPPGRSFGPGGFHPGGPPAAGRPGLFQPGGFRPAAAAAPAGRPSGQGRRPDEHH